jgi:hypothetical protein
MDFIEILDNRKRLRQYLLSILQDGHESLRVHAEKFRTQLLATAAREMYGQILVTQAFQVQRNAHAVRGGTAEKAIEFHQEK